MNVSHCGLRALQLPEGDALQLPAGDALPGGIMPKRVALPVGDATPQAAVASPWLRKIRRLGESSSPGDMLDARGDSWMGTPTQEYVAKRVVGSSASSASSPLSPGPVDTSSLGILSASQGLRIAVKRLSKAERDRVAWEADRKRAEDEHAFIYGGRDPW